MPAFPLSLFAAILRGAPFQPATDFWRAIELTALIERGLPQAAQARAILDLGCGDGEIMRLLRPYLPPQAVLTGVDIDPAETALAEATGFYANVLCSGAERMALPDASQDAVISNSVLEHIKPIKDVLAESARVLKPGGVFLATVPGPDFYKGLSGSWLPGVGRDVYFKALDQRLAHERYWGKAQWREALGQVGIDLIEARPYLSRAAVRRWELLSRLTGGLLYTLTGGARRPIFLQRALGMRRKKERSTKCYSVSAPSSAALRRDDGEKKARSFSEKAFFLFARLLSAGIAGEPFANEADAAPYGCLLLVGRRR